MATSRFSEWMPIRIYGQGIQPRTARHWNCEPAWDFAAYYHEPDELLPHPEKQLAKSDPAGNYPNKDKQCPIFWDRHVDRRFYLEYPHAGPDTPRAQGRTIVDPQREWEIVIQTRDQILRDAGLTLNSPPRQIAKALADSFLYEKFEKKPLCPTFSREPRQLHFGVEGLLYKSYCAGCAHAMMILADVTGLPSRVVGCMGHLVTEVLVEGRWYLVDSCGRHPPGDTDAFFNGSYLDTILNPMGDWARRIPRQLRHGLWRRPNGQYHFSSGTWSSPCTLRYGPSNAYALYPDRQRWGFKSADGKRLDIINRTGGFYWPVVHADDHARLDQVRLAALPLPMHNVPSSRDYLFHPFLPGQILRQSVYLDAVDDAERFELTLSFGPSRASDFSPAAGNQLVVQINDFQTTLNKAGAWPPVPRANDAKGGVASGEMLLFRLQLPREVFKPNQVNWIFLRHQGSSVYYAPCLPVAMEPYIPPLWSETTDLPLSPLPAENTVQAQA